MSTRHPTRRGFLPAPFQEIRVSVTYCGTHTVVTYLGAVELVIAAGAATEAMFVRDRRGHFKAGRDGQGDRWHVHKSPTAACPERVRLQRFVSCECASLLPGVLLLFPVVLNPEPDTQLPLRCPVVQLHVRRRERSYTGPGEVIWLADHKRRAQRIPKLSDGPFGGAA